MNKIIILLLICLIFSCGRDKVSDNSSQTQVVSHTKSIIDGLLAYYPFNGNANDASGNGKNGTVKNDATLGKDRFGNAANAYAFKHTGIKENGYDNEGNLIVIDDDAHIELPQGFDDFSAGLTISLWAKPDHSTGSWARFVELGNGIGQNNIMFYRKGDSEILAFEVRSANPNSGVIVEAANAIEYNTWAHYAVTQNASGNVILYKNGEIIASGVTAVPDVISRSKNYIAKSNWPTDGYFHGVLDEVRVYQRALTQEEIRLLPSSPAVTIKYPHAALIANANPVLNYHVADNCGHTETVILDGQVITTANGGTLSNLADGEHALTIFSENAQGNKTTVSTRFTVNSSVSGNATIGSEVGAIVLKSNEYGNYYQYMPTYIKKPTRVMVIVHGSIALVGGDALPEAMTMIKRWTGIAEEKGMLLIAPAFDDPNFGGYAGAGGGYRGAFGRYIDADMFVVNIVENYRNMFVAFDQKMHMMGHSAGGQFVNRFIVLHPDRIANLVVSASGSFAYPDASLAWADGMGYREDVAGWCHRCPFTPDQGGWMDAATKQTTVVIGENDMFFSECAPKANKWVNDMILFAENNSRTPDMDYYIVDTAQHNSWHLWPINYKELFRPSFACRTYSATNEEHVTAGRAEKITTGYWIWQTTTYYTIGSHESLGTSGSSVTSVKESPRKYYAAGSCPVNQAPVITLQGDAEMSLALGSPFVDPGATALDQEDGNLTSQVEVLGNVDPAVIGSYKIYYNVQDSQNTPAVQVVRTVHIVDNQQPVISLIGDAEITINQGSSFVDPGANAIDAQDGDISHLVQVSGSVDVNTIGDYVLFYNVTDSDGNAAQSVQRTIHVVLGVTCQEYTATVQQHITEGRAIVCGYFNMYGCAVGSGVQIGSRYSIIDYTLHEDPQGYFEVGTCPAN